MKSGEVNDMQTVEVNIGSNDFHLTQHAASKNKNTLKVYN